MTKRLKMPPLEMGGDVVLSDNELQEKADEIFEILRVLPGPKDACAVYTGAYLQFIEASFPPEYRDQAKLAVDEFAKFIKSELDRGWQ
jgi:hypothetical protein